MRIVIVFVGLAVAALLSGCTVLPQACAPPAQSMVSAELVFGRNIGDRLGVSDAAFADFLAREITPRFPDGLTAIADAYKKRFRQQSVLISLRTSCVTF
jgi:hypothetical protein